MNGVNLILSFRRPAMYTLSFRHHVLAQIARGSRGSRSFCVKRPPTPNQSIYVSKSTDPYFNLTLEDWYAFFLRALLFLYRLQTGSRRLFRHKAPDGPLLFVYRDDPCVILGRNQNPWKEIHIPTLRKVGIPFVRRRSGGGTVYHVRYSRVILLTNKIHHPSTS